MSEEQKSNEQKGGLAWVVREVHRFSTKPDGGAITCQTRDRRGMGRPWRGRGGGRCSVCRLQYKYIPATGTSGEIEAGLTSRKSLDFSAWEAVLLRVNALTVVTTTPVGQ